jgi:16S rRNA processing protein RimM
MDKERLFTIGKIVKPHGIKGEAKVEILTDSPEYFEEFDEALIGKEQKDEELILVKIESSRFHKDGVLVKFDIMNTPEEVDKYRNYIIMLPESCLKELEENEYYIDDIVGTSVFTTSGIKVGEITRIISGGFQDVYEITDKETGKVNMIPSSKEFIKSIEVDNKKMIIEPIEGLLEL